MPDDGFIISGGKRIIKNICANYVERFEIQGILFVYALTWDDVFQSFDLRHAFLLDKLKMDKEAIAAEIAQTAGDEKSKDTADALTALVAN